MSIDNTFVFDFWILATVVCVKWCFVVVLICVSLVTDSVECLFMWLLALFISTLEKCVFISFAIFKLSYLSFYYWTERVFFFAIHILDIKAFIRYTNCQHFLPFCGPFFHFLMMSFEAQVSLILMMYSWFFSCVACTFGILFKNLLPDPRLWRLSLCFS